MGHYTNHRSSSSVSSTIDTLFASISFFLKKHCNTARPLLIALSGGPDSIALLHLVLQYCKKHPINLHLAHVDHGWREESSSEAAELKCLADKLQIPFHLCTLDSSRIKGNVEDACRRLRYAFFEELAMKLDFQAVALGHHADDQAETVLKRLLEGASLPAISAMRPVARRGKLCLWRPLLAHRKDEILNWLDQRKISYFTDSTNRDLSYLRSRMRMEMIPTIEKHLGKSIHKNLTELAKQAQELQDHLDIRLKILSAVLARGPFGVYFDIANMPGISVLECKTLVKMLAEEAQVDLSRETLSRMAEALLDYAANKLFLAGEKRMAVDRGRFFLIEKPFNEREESFPLNEGVFFVGNWQLTVSKCSGSCVSGSSDWKDIWKGESFLVLPKNAALHTVKAPPSLKKIWSNAKVPACLYTSAPYFSTPTGSFYSALYNPAAKMQEAFSVVLKYVGSLEEF